MKINELKNLIYGNDLQVDKKNEFYPLVKEILDEKTEANYQSVSLSKNDIVWIKKSAIHGKLTDEQMNLLGLNKENYLTIEEFDQIKSTLINDLENEKVFESFRKVMGEIPDFIAEELESLDEAALSDIFEKAVPLIKNINDPNRRIAIFFAITMIPIENREPQVLDGLLSIINDEYLFDVLFLISDLDKVDRSDFFKALPLIKGIFEEQNRTEIIGAILEIKKNDRSDVIEKAAPFIKDIPVADQRLNIINIISNIEKDYRTDLLKAIPLIKDISDKSQCADILEVISKIDKEDRTDVIEKAVSFTEDISDGLQRADILQAISKINKENRADVIEKALLFTEEVPDENRFFILEAISWIGKEDQENFTSEVLATFVKLKEYSSFLNNKHFEEAYILFSSLKEGELELAVKFYPKLTSVLIQLYPEDMVKKMENTSFESLPIEKKIHILPLINPESVKTTISAIEEEEIKNWLQDIIYFDKLESGIYSFAGTVPDILYEVNRAIQAQPRDVQDPNIRKELLEQIPIKTLAAVAKVDPSELLDYLPKLQYFQLAVVVPVLPNDFLFSFLENQPLDKHANFLSHATNEQKNEYIEKFPKLSEIQNSWITSDFNSYKENLRNENYDKNELYKNWTAFFIKIKTDVEHSIISINRLKNWLTNEQTPNELKEKIEDKLSKFNKDLTNIQMEYTELNNKIQAEHQKEDHIPEEFIDLITGNIMENPVENEGINLDEKTWNRLIAEKKNNPFTNKELSIDKFVKNTTLQEEIEEYLKEHPQESE